jgi:hypothetical protein
MSWFDDLRRVLQPYYPPGEPADVVGYVRGAAKDQPATWRAMEAAGRAQMIVLGARPPALAEWQAAGVGGRSEQHVILIGRMAGFRVVYGGFSLRPWGKIVVEDDDARRHWPGQLDAWRRNLRPPR